MVYKPFEEGKEEEDWLQPPGVCCVCKTIPKCIVESSCCESLYCKDCATQMKDSNCSECGGLVRNFQPNTILQQKIDEFLKQLKRNPEQCFYCMQEVDDLEKHKEYDCPNVEIDCPLCKEKILRNEVEEHVEKNQTHAKYLSAKAETMSKEITRLHEEIASLKQQNAKNPIVVCLDQLFSFLDTMNEPFPWIYIWVIGFILLVYVVATKPYFHLIPLFLYMIVMLYYVLLISIVHVSFLWKSIVSIYLFVVWVVLSVVIYDL